MTRALSIITLGLAVAATATTVATAATQPPAHCTAVPAYFGAVRERRVRRNRDDPSNKGNVTIADYLFALSPQNATLERPEGAHETCAEEGFVARHSPAQCLGSFKLPIEPTDADANIDGCAWAFLDPHNGFNATIRVTCDPSTKGAVVYDGANRSTIAAFDGARIEYESTVIFGRSSAACKPAPTPTPAPPKRECPAVPSGIGNNTLTVWEHLVNYTNASDTSSRTTSQYYSGYAVSLHTAVKVPGRREIGGKMGRDCVNPTFVARFAPGSGNCGESEFTIREEKPAPNANTTAPHRDCWTYRNIDGSKRITVVVTCDHAAPADGSIVFDSVNRTIYALNKGTFDNTTIYGRSVFVCRPRTNVTFVTSLTAPQLVAEARRVIADTVPAALAATYAYALARSTSATDANDEFPEEDMLASCNATDRGDGNHTCAVAFTSRTDAGTVTKAANDGKMKGVYGAVIEDDGKKGEDDESPVSKIVVIGIIVGIVSVLTVGISVTVFLHFRKKRAAEAEYRALNN